MSNSIWHKRDETPKDFCDVVLSDSRTGSYCVFLSPFHDLSFNYDRWCYFDELLAQADKAERLQKAQDALKEIKETVDAFKDSEFAEDMRDCVRTISQILASIPTEKDK